MASIEVESPSGKGAADENFPVGSVFLPARLRPHIAVYYAYARAIDDVADSSQRPVDDKLETLNRFAAAIRGEEDDPAFEKAHCLRRSLIETGVCTDHALDLVSAFRQDALKSRYENWGELIDYCNRSAAPVGRYLLDLHGDGPAAYPYSDALCNALQVINHLQDCGDDYRALGRVYIPLDWLAGAGETVDALSKGASSPGLRQTMDRMLDGVDELLTMAEKLPAALGSRRLALESAFITGIARRLARRLRHQDPLAMRVELGRLGFLTAGFVGICRFGFRSPGKVV